MEKLLEMRKHAAFFDFDGTLIRGDSQAMEMRHILRSGCRRHVNPFLIMRTVGTGILSYFDLVSQLYHNRTYITIYRGMSEQDAVKTGNSIFHTQIRKNFNLQALKLLEDHRDEGALIVIVSASPEHILEPVTAYIKPDFLVCTVLEKDLMKRFTGKPLGHICIGEEKAERVQELAIKFNLDLSSSYAYSDHHADLPFLEAVGRPAAVNPTVKLEKIAREREWPVYRFR